VEELLRGERLDDLELVLAEKPLRWTILRVLGTTPSVHPFRDDERQLDA
jgi:hypothetical protein